MNITTRSSVSIEMNDRLYYMYINTLYGAPYRNPYTAQRVSDQCQFAMRFWRHGSTVYVQWLEIYTFFFPLLGDIAIIHIVSCATKYLVGRPPIIQNLLGSHLSSLNF